MLIIIHVPVGLSYVFLGKMSIQVFCPFLIGLLVYIIYLLTSLNFSFHMCKLKEILTDFKDNSEDKR